MVDTVSNELEFRNQEEVKFDSKWFGHVSAKFQELSK